MMAEFPDCSSGESALQVYLLGCVDFETLLRFQRLLHFEVTGDRRQAALVLCEHPPLITVGRRGSRSHIRLEAEELQWRGWPIRWVNRGGGCVLHLPGQIATYAIMPLDRLGLTVTDYVQRLSHAICDLLADFSVEAHPGEDGVTANERMVAAVGVSVRDWVSTYGAYTNIHPALDLFRHVSTSDDDALPMTSLVRERGGPVRPSLVRERLVEHFRVRFGFGRVALFTDHPALGAVPQRLTAPAGITEPEKA